MIQLADQNLWALQITVESLASWVHERIEITTLCCELLQRVMEHTTEQSLVRPVVCLLCRIAFRHPVPGIETHVDLLDSRTLERLLTFVQDWDVELTGDLITAFASLSWSEKSEGCILRAILLNIPASGLSPSSQGDIITLLGTARWSLVGGLDRGRLTTFVGVLPTDMVVERIISDGPVCTGLMRLLLFSTFRPPPETDTRPLWAILLAALPKIPHFFSRNLPDHIDPAEASLADFNDGHDSEIHGKVAEVLWMKLFWSSRFFEMDCELWSEFRDATAELGQGRPALIQLLERLCFGLEEARAGPDSAMERTQACKEMAKLQAVLLGPSQERSEPHISITGEHPLSVQSGSGANRSLDAGPQLTQVLVLPNRDEVESAFGLPSSSGKRGRAYNPCLRTQGSINFTRECIDPTPS